MSTAPLPVIAFVPRFQSAADALAKVAKSEGLTVTAGSWLGSAVLSVTQPHWMENAATTSPTKIGIFFSVWIEEKSLRQNRVFYNLHALKLRKLSAFRLESRTFADAFRERAADRLREWPNLSVDFGPQTLLQGWIELDEARLAQDAAALVRRFIPLIPLIDELLAARAKTRLK